MRTEGAYDIVARWTQARVSACAGHSVEGGRRMSMSSLLHTCIETLQTMSNIYNILGGNGSARYSTYMAMIKYASNAGKTELVKNKMK